MIFFIIYLFLMSKGFFSKKFGIFSQKIKVFFQKNSEFFPKKLGIFFKKIFIINFKMKNHFHISSIILLFL